MNYYLHKVIPPRPTFAAMTETEFTIMSEHVATGRTRWTRTSRRRSAQSLTHRACTAWQWSKPLTSRRSGYWLKSTR